jgi:BASS family bile acid:Na+ symporter
VTSPLFSVVLPVVMAVVMFGLGLALTVADFTRVLTVPRAVLVTLLCQVVLLPLVCFGLVVGVGLDPDFAIGMMVLAASPGGVMATVFSHLAGGDVALNITVTAVNSVLAVVTLPVVVALSVAYFAGDGAVVGLQTGKLVQVAFVLLAPVALGMAVRRRFPAFADRMERPVRVASLVAVFLVICAAILQELDGFLVGLAEVGLLCTAFSVLSLTLGYAVPRLARVGHRQAVSAALEIGIHNAVVAITVAVTVLDHPEAAIPPAMYGALMFFPAGVFARLMARRATRAARSSSLPSAEQ